MSQNVPPQTVHRRKAAPLDDCESPVIPERKPETKTPLGANSHANEHPSSPGPVIPAKAGNDVPPLSPTATSPFLPPVIPATAGNQVPPSRQQPPLHPTPRSFRRKPGYLHDQPLSTFSRPSAPPRRHSGESRKPRPTHRVTATRYLHRSTPPPTRPPPVPRNPRTQFHTNARPPTVSKKRKTPHYLPLSASRYMM